MLLQLTPQSGIPAAPSDMWRFHTCFVHSGPNHLVNLEHFPLGSVQANPSEPKRITTHHVRTDLLLLLTGQMCLGWQQESQYSKYCLLD